MEAPQYFDKGQRSITFDVTLDFDKMMDDVLDKHWGYMGRRPESFEEYCTMLVAEHLRDHIEWNEFRQSEALTAVKKWIDDVGRERAEKAVAQCEAPDNRYWDMLGYGKNDDDTQTTPEQYYGKRVQFWLDVRAKDEADRLAREARDD